MVAKLLADAHTKANGKEKLTKIREIGAVVYAMVQSERGVTAVQRKHVLAAVKKGKLPNPRFPTQIAAE